MNKLVKLHVQTYVPRLKINTFYIWNMLSQSELIFRIEIKCAIFKRIIVKRPFASHIFKTQTNICRIFGRSYHHLKVRPENLPCLQFTSKPAIVTRRFYFAGKDWWCHVLKHLLSNRICICSVILHSLGDPWPELLRRSAQVGSPKLCSMTNIYWIDWTITITYCPLNDM